MEVFQERPTECGSAVVPVPVRDSAVGEPEALLAKLSDALAVPLAFGVKVTANGTDCPACIVAGRLIPNSANSELLLVPDETVTEAPLAVKLPFSEEFAPTTTFPKLSVAGDTDNWPCAVPVPDIAMLRGELEASDAMETAPLAEPAAEGENIALKVTLWFGLRVVGRLSPVIVKLALLTLACEIVTGDPPVFVSVSDRVELLPACTLPKPRLEGFADRIPGLALEFELELSP